MKMGGDPRHAKVVDLNVPIVFGHEVVYLVVMVPEYVGLAVGGGLDARGHGDESSSCSAWSACR